ncbi:MAG: hypothetical protein AAF998_20565 [Bacteroidota bacterium]
MNATPHPALRRYTALFFLAGIGSLFGQSPEWKTSGNNNLDPNCFIGTTDPVPVRIKVNGTTQMEFTPNGPVKLPSLSGTGRAYVTVAGDGTLLRQTDPAVDSLFDCSSKLWKADGNYLAPDCFLGSTNAAALRIFTHNTERMRVTESGRIGIEHTTTNNNNATNRLVINPGGNRTDFGGDVVLDAHLGLGTDVFFDNINGKDYRLSVDGRIRAQEIKVYSGWADHVFARDYVLMPLTEVEAFIAQHGHLPGLPSAEEVATNGVEIGQTQAQLLEKIEELTLHLIRLEKENRALKADVSPLIRSNSE